MIDEGLPSTQIRVFLSTLPGEVLTPSASRFASTMQDMEVQYV
jgi:hypothetical protein